MRIIFAGTPHTAIPTLHALAKCHEIIAVYTREPAPQGRKRVLTNSPVHDYALQHGYPVYTPSTLRDPDVARELQDLAPDAVAVVAYGLLIPEELLQIPRLGWFNLHYSLLPRWRGAAPVQAAIAAGDQTIGTCVFQIEKGLDTGPVLSKNSFVLDRSLTAGEILAQLSESGAEQMVHVFSQLAAGTATSHDQEGESSYAPMINAQMAQIDWDRPASSVQNQIHAYLPEPGSWTEFNAKRIKINAVKVQNENSSEFQPGSIFLIGKKFALLQQKARSN
ncbi:methionyl-tRNA formyltransferase [Arcanobacterium hippocoleae]|uniref:methionyl-tRNA formyltransferase n=1 Tax=Arcanobacterium hippocoleae TaxID=149017 RepID=UPI00334268DA